MPAAREALPDAARTALARRPWPAARLLERAPARPGPPARTVRFPSAAPAQRRARRARRARHARAAPPPSPAGCVALVRDRAVAVLAGPGGPGDDTAGLGRSCELVVRPALSRVVAPPAGDGVADPVRGALHRRPVP